jgi:hypothetical protein
VKPSFKKGKKYIGSKVVEAKHRLFTYGSDGETVYTATLWLDGTTSCNCPAWRFAKGDTRKCKHSERAASLTATVDETGQMTKATTPAAQEQSHGTTPFKRRSRTVDT